MAAVPITSEALLPDVPKDRLPRHIAIIMDGNGRWAEQRGLPRIEGHRRGVRTVREVTEMCARLGLDTITLYCLSSENWKRPAAELKFLMHLMQQYLIEERRTLVEHGFRLQVIGRRDRLPPEVLEEMDRALALSEGNRGLRIVLAIDYGGRDELVRAARRLVEDVVRGELAAEEVGEAALAARLDTAGLSDPDLMIRTGGDMRVSNFLLWQLSYAELWMTPKLWPEFRRGDLFEAIRDFAGRQRRFGGLADDPAPG